MLLRRQGQVDGSSLGGRQVDDRAWKDALAKWDGTNAEPSEELILLHPKAGVAKERAGKIGRAKVMVRQLALDRLNALVLAPTT